MVSIVLSENMNFAKSNKCNETIFYLEKNNATKSTEIHLSHNSDANFLFN
jgi:hypothetical protein